MSHSWSFTPQEVNSLLQKQLGLNQMLNFWIPQILWHECRSKDIMAKTVVDSYQFL